MCPPWAIFARWTNRAPQGRAQAQQAEKARQGAAFGQQTQQQELDLADMNLPKGFEKFLK